MATKTASTAVAAYVFYNPGGDTTVIDFSASSAHDGTLQEIMESYGF